MKSESRIQRARNKAVIPALEQLAAEIQERAENGTLAQELKAMKASSLIHNLTKIITAIKANSPVVIVPQHVASDDKDPSWFRAHSVTGMSEYERERFRSKVLRGEILDNGQAKEEVDSKPALKEGSPTGEGPEGRRDRRTRAYKKDMAREQSLGQRSDSPASAPSDSLPEDAVNLNQNKETDNAQLIEPQTGPSPSGEVGGPGQASHPLPSP